MIGCKRGCCWNPWGTCGRRYACPCHTATPKRRTLDDLIAEYEQGGVQ